MSSKGIELKTDGFDDFESLLSEYTKKASKKKVNEALEEGARAFVDDLLKLPKPKSEITKAGYTHLIDSFLCEMRKDEAVVGWGKYYGRMIENGTKRMKAQPHLVPLFNKNKNSYYQVIIKKLGFN